jgi:hypothetical protein
MAAMRVAALIGSALITGVLVHVGIHYFGLAIVGTIFAVAVLAYMAKFVYDIELAKLESLNALNKLKELK